MAFKRWNWVPLAVVLLAAAWPTARAAEAAAEVNPAREELDKRKEEWKKLSPEERDARLKEWRKTNGGPNREEWDKRREAFQKMTPEEREAKRKEIKERLESRIAELRGKQTNSTITAQEGRELSRGELILKRFEQNGTAPPRDDRPKSGEPAAPAPK